MVNISLSIPDELYNQMKQVNYSWDKIAIKAFEEALNKTIVIRELVNALNKQDEKRIKQLTNDIIINNSLFNQ